MLLRQGAFHFLLCGIDHSTHSESKSATPKCSPSYLDKLVDSVGNGNHQSDQERIDQKFFLVGRKLVDQDVPEMGVNEINRISQGPENL